MDALSSQDKFLCDVYELRHIRGRMTIRIMFDTPQKMWTWATMILVTFTNTVSDAPELNPKLGFQSPCYNGLQLQIAIF